MGPVPSEGCFKGSLFFLGQCAATGLGCRFHLTQATRAWPGDWTEPWVEAGRVPPGPGGPSQDLGSPLAHFSAPPDVSAQWGSNSLRTSGRQKMKSARDRSRCTGI